MKAIKYMSKIFFPLLIVMGVLVLSGCSGGSSGSSSDSSSDSSSSALGSVSGSAQ